MADHPIIFSTPMVRALLDGRKTQTRRLAWRKTSTDIATGETYGLKGTPWKRVMRGDRLWVREAWSLHPGGVMRYGALHRAGHEEERSSGPRVDHKWRPSIHMPRWASRITLHVEAVRVERLWSISEADALAEGVIPSPQNRSGHPLAPHLAAFSDLWIKLHNHTTWATNPEVVALTFHVALANIDADA